MYEVALGYVVGSAASLLLFRAWIKEGIINGTLDMLIREDYVRSWIDDEGIIQLSKLDEGIPDVGEITPEVWAQFEKIIQEMKEEDEEYEEEDDTP